MDLTFDYLDLDLKPESGFPDVMPGTPRDDAGLEQELATLEPTWWIFDREPGMDDLMEQAGDSLKETMFDRLEVQPFQDTDGNDRLFLARFEIPIYGKNFQKTDGVISGQHPAAFIDFLGGFPLECCEMLMAIGERSSSKDKVPVLPGEDAAAAPVPQEFFVGYDEDRVLLNYLYLTPENVQWMAKNLDGEPGPANLHWWLRVNLVEDSGSPSKWPLPGEFMGLGVRMMPDKPWGSQKSSPFIYSGNWMDTVYYTGAVIKEVQEPTDDQPYSTYTVIWRGQEITEVRPSDFAEYKVDDRVTILKDVTTEKESQLWRDDDMKEFDKDKWMIAPITFYGLEKEE